MFTIPPEVRYSSLATPNSYTLRTSNFYGVFGGLDAVDTSAGSITETLPLNPNIGAWLVTADLAGTWATNPLVLDGNGQMILGAYSNIDCDLSNSVVTLIFVGGTVGWQLYISHLSTGGGVVPGQQLFDNTPALFLDAGARQLFGTDGVTPLIDLNLTTTGYADFPQGLSAGGGFITTCYSGGYITTNNYGGSIDTSNSGGYIDTSNSGGLITTSYGGGSIDTSYSGSSISTSNGGGLITTSYGGGFITTCYSGGYITTNNYGGSIDTSNSGGYIDTCYSGGSITTSYSGGSIDTSNSGGYIDTSNRGGLITTCYGGGFITTNYGGGSIDTSNSGGYIDTNNYGGSIDTSNSGGYIDTSNGGAGIVTASYTPSAGWLFAFDGSNMVPTDPTGFTVGTANYATNAYGLIDPSTATGFTPDSMGNFSTPGGIGIFSAAALTSQPAAIANSDPITVSDKLNALLAVMRNYGFIAT